jgi:hypothetical protein
MSRGVGHIPMHRFALPGGISPQGLRVLLGQAMSAPTGQTAPTYRELVESGAVIAGSPATVREPLADQAHSFRIGQLLANLQIGSMPTELTRYNIDLFSTEVLPHLRGIWSEYDGDNRWWPERLGGRPVSTKQADLTGARLK